MKELFIPKWIFCRFYQICTFLNLREESSDRRGGVPWKLYVLFGLGSLSRGDESMRVKEILHDDADRNGGEAGDGKFHGG